MAQKRATGAGKRGKKVKDLRVQSTSSRKAGAVRGGKPGLIEIDSFSFGAENPTTIGSGAGGSGAGKVSLGELNIKKP